MNPIQTWTSAHKFSEPDEAREVFAVEMRRQMACLAFSTAFGLCRFLGIHREQIDLALDQVGYESNVMDSI